MFLTFLKIDVNRDQRLDLNEFRSLLVRSLGAGAENLALDTSNAGQYASGSFESSSASFGDASGAEVAGASAYSAGVAGGESSFGSFEQSSFSSTSGAVSGGFEAANFADASVSSGETTGFASQSTVDSSYQQQIQLAAGSNQNIFHDPNPQIVRRPAQGGNLTYTQNIRVRFLQPPPVPPPGVSYSDYQHSMCFTRSFYVLYYSHSSSKKFVHLSHLHHHLFVSVNKLHLFHNHHHLFYVKDHQIHHLLLHLKLVNRNSKT